MGLCIYLLQRYLFCKTHLNCRPEHSIADCILLLAQEIRRRIGRAVNHDLPLPEAQTAKEQRKQVNGGTSFIFTPHCIPSCAAPDLAHVPATSQAAIHRPTAVIRSFIFGTRASLGPILARTGSVSKRTVIRISVSPDNWYIQLRIRVNSNLPAVVCIQYFPGRGAPFLRAHAYAHTRTYARTHGSTARMVICPEVNQDSTTHSTLSRPHDHTLPARTQLRPRAGQKTAVEARNAALLATISDAPAAQSRNEQPVPHGGAQRPDTQRWMLPISPFRCRPRRASPRTYPAARRRSAASFQLTPAMSIAEAAAAAFRAGMAAATAAEFQMRAADTLAQAAKAHDAASSTRAPAAAAVATVAGQKRGTSGRPVSSSRSTGGNKRSAATVGPAAQAAAVMSEEDAQAKVAVGLAAAVEAATRAQEATVKAQEAATKAQEAATATAPSGVTVAQTFGTAVLSSEGPAGWDSTGGVHQQQSADFGQLACPIGTQGLGENTVWRI